MTISFYCCFNFFYCLGMFILLSFWFFVVLYNLIFQVIAIDVLLMATCVYVCVCVCVCARARVCVCVCVCTSVYVLSKAKASSVWISWDTREQINHVILKTLIPYAKSLHHYFRMQHLTFLTSHFILFAQQKWAKPRLS